MPETADTQPVKMPLTSMDIVGEKRERLKQCLTDAFPEVMAEDKIDFDQLKRVLGEWVEPGPERFGLNWPGKAACMRVIQSPSIATLKPCLEESVNWDTTACFPKMGLYSYQLMTMSFIIFGKSVIRYSEKKTLLVFSHGDQEQQKLMFPMVFQKMWNGLFATANKAFWQDAQVKEITASQMTMRTVGVYKT